MDVFNVVIPGLVSGSLYAVTALGLSVAYRASRVLNFALGGIGIVAAYIVFWMLEVQVPYAIAIVVGIVVGAILGGLTELLIVRPLRHQDHLTVAIGTLGLLLILQGAVGSVWGYNTKSLPLPLSAAFTVQIGDLSVGSSSVLMLVVTTLAVIGSFLLISRTNLGLAMRATSAGPATASMLGIDTAMVRMASWVLGGACGALAALFVAPQVYLDPMIFTQFSMVAFAAVVLGGFTSLRGVLIGGLAFGVGVNLVSAYVSSNLVKTVTFVVIIAVLSLRPHGLFGTPEQTLGEPPTHDYTQSTIVGGGRRSRLGSGRRLPQWVWWLGLLAVLMVLPFLFPTSTYRLSTALATYVVILGLNILAGYSGQLSLSHAGFMAVGAYISALASARWGWSLAIALPLAMVGTGILGVIVGLPASRLSGLYLALLTLAFGWSVPEVATKLEYIGGVGGLPFPPPAMFATNEGKYWLALGVAVLATIAMLMLIRSSIGRHWRAVRDSEQGAKSIGLDTARVKLGAFGCSAALAGLGGALLGMMVGYVGPETYSIWLAVYMLVGVVVGGSGSVIGSLIGALFLTFVPVYTAEFHVAPDIVYGVALTGLLVISPAGLAALPALIQRRAARRYLVASEAG